MLDQTPVSRSLDRKSTILWLEMIDLFCLVLLCAILNFVFGSFHFKFAFVYGPTLLAAVVLIMAKRGKPEKFLFHLLRHLVLPKHLTCFDLGPMTSPFKSSKKRKVSK